MDWGKFFTVPTQGDWLGAALFLVMWTAFCLLVAGIVMFVLTRRRLAKSPFSRAVKGPIIIVLLVAGLVRGLAAAIEFLANESGQAAEAKWVHKVAIVVWVCAMTLCAARAVSRYFQFRVEEQDQSQGLITNRLIVTRKLVLGAVLGIGGVMILEGLGVNAGPLLAGGAIGGVVIGLALQESLSNVFSGFFFAMDDSVRVGDLVRFPNGKEGFVHQIGWRSTIVRLLDDSQLVVPNAQMSKFELINMSRPVLPVVISVECSVGFDADLARVEAIALGVATKVQDQFDTVGADPPFVRWLSFGESGMVFRTFVTVPSPESQYRARSELVKGLHASLTAAGMAVPYPVRDVRLTPASQTDAP